MVSSATRWRSTRGRAGACRSASRISATACTARPAAPCTCRWPNGSAAPADRDRDLERFIGAAWPSPRRLWLGLQPGRQLRPRPPLPAEEGLAISKGAEGGAAMTVCESARGRAPQSLLWLWPDYTGHHTPLGSPARPSIASADANVSRVAETIVARSTGEHPLCGRFRSWNGGRRRDDRSHRLLIDAGLKHTPSSSDVVVAPTARRHLFC